MRTCRFGVSAVGVAAVLAVAAWTGSAAPADQTRREAPGAGASFYDLKTRTLDGTAADLAAYRGRVSLVVNVASYCGYTPQYEGLEALHRELRGRGFTVLGFPSNDFGEQEPGSAAQIAEFCRLTYDVTFPMFEKVVTRPGPAQSPVYMFLGTSGNLPAWNFSKYVIDRRGRVVAFFPSDVTPADRRLRAAILEALAAR